MREVYHHLVVEPTLQPLTSESLHPASDNISDAARLDVKADGFWDCDQQSAFFDVRIFNPTAHACCHRPLSLCYRHHEFEKRRQYEDRVLQVEHGSFTPPIFLTAGGVGPSATVIFKCLVSLLAIKQGTHYSKVM